jgi:hypothetical protein
MGIFDIFSAGPGQQAAQDQIAADQRGYQDLSRQFGLGRGALTTDYAKALVPFQANFDVANQGQNALADAMGLNGPEGNARAAAAFQNNPGYQFQVQQGLNSVMANQARTGQLASGNTDLALQQMGSNLANQNWGNYIGQLQPFLGAAGNAATGIAGVNTGLGNAMNTSYTGQGQAAYGTDVSQGKAQAAGDLAGYNASGNLWGAALGALGDVASIAGGKGVSAPTFK